MRAMERIRMVNTAGIISTVAGNGAAGYLGDGGQATAAQLNQPFGLAFDAANNFYIADKVNSRVRKVNSAGIISTIQATEHRAFQEMEVLQLPQKYLYPIV